MPREVERGPQCIRPRPVTRSDREYRNRSRIPCRTQTPAIRVGPVSLSLRPRQTPSRLLGRNRCEPLPLSPGPHLRTCSLKPRPQVGMELRRFFDLPVTPGPHVLP